MLCTFVIVVYMPATLAARFGAVTDRTLIALQRQESVELHTGQTHVLQVTVSSLLLHGFQVTGAVLALALIDKIAVGFPLDSRSLTGISPDTI
jgi:hypothetical protein